MFENVIGTRLILILFYLLEIRKKISIKPHRIFKFEFLHWIFKHITILVIFL